MPAGIAAPSGLLAEMIRWWLPCPFQSVHAGWAEPETWYFTARTDGGRRSIQLAQQELEEDVSVALGALSAHHGDKCLPFKWHCKVVTILFPFLLLILKIRWKCFCFALHYICKQTVSDIESISPAFTHIVEAALWQAFLLEVALASAAPPSCCCFLLLHLSLKCPGTTGLHLPGKGDWGTLPCLKK